MVPLCDPSRNIDNVGPDKVLFCVGGLVGVGIAKLVFGGNKATVHVLNGSMPLDFVKGEAVGSLKMAS